MKIYYASIITRVAGYVTLKEFGIVSSIIFRLGQIGKALSHECRKSIQVIHILEI